MISTSGYTVAGTARPLSHARILWQPIAGTVTADGTGGDLATNDFTHQRWQAGTGTAVWTLQTAALLGVDCVFIAAHNLGGATVTIATSSTVDGAFTTRATLAPTVDRTMVALFNTSGGAPHGIRRLRVTVAENQGIARAVGIIRAGIALQMQRALFAGHAPLGLIRRTVLREQESETGQFLGRIVQRRMLQTSYDWSNLRQGWYRSNFEPFAQTLPGRPFGIAGNPAEMPEDVGWCWAGGDLAPSLTGPRDLMAVSLPVAGFW